MAWALSLSHRFRFIGLYIYHHSPINARSNVATRRHNRPPSIVRCRPIREIDSFQTFAASLSRRHALDAARLDNLPERRILRYAAHGAAISGEAMGSGTEDPNSKSPADTPRLDELRGRIVGRLRAPAFKLARVLHAFVGDGQVYRVRTFYSSLTSLADEDLFEAQRCYSFADSSDEEIHKGLFAGVELERRYALDPDLAIEKYLKWLDATEREDSNWPPTTREAWRVIRKRLREKKEEALH
jgi:hypothetical protein